MHCVRPGPSHHLHAICMWADYLNSLNLHLLICKMGIVTSSSILLWGLSIYKVLPDLGLPLLWAYILWCHPMAYSFSTASASWPVLKLIRQVSTTGPLHQLFSLLPPFPLQIPNGSPQQVLASMSPVLWGLFSLTSSALHPPPATSETTYFVFSSFHSIYHLLICKTVYLLLMIHLLFLEYKPCEGQDLCALHTDVSQQPEQSLAHSRHTINIYWMNELISTWMNAWMKSLTAVPGIL